jgi:hypothetical protein
MANANITTLVNGFAVVPVDNTAQQNFQDDVIFEIARGVIPNVLVQVRADFIAAVAGQERYTLSQTALASPRTPLMIFYDATQLTLIRKLEAWEYATAWRRSPNPTVVGYTFDPEDRFAFSLVPPPTRSGAAIGANTPTNVTTWPDGNITVVATWSDLNFLGANYVDLHLPIALEVLAREFARDSDHQDLTMSTMCRNLSQFFFRMTQPAGKPL